MYIVYTVEKNGDIMSYPRAYPPGEGWRHVVHHRRANAQERACIARKRDLIYRYETLEECLENEDKFLTVLEIAELEAALTGQRRPL